MHYITLSTSVAEIKVRLHGGNGAYQLVDTGDGETDNGSLGLIVPYNGIATLRIPEYMDEDYAHYGPGAIFVYFSEYYSGVVPVNTLLVLCEPQT